MKEVDVYRVKEGKMYYIGTFDREGLRLLLADHLDEFYAIYEPEDASRMRCGKLLAVWRHGQLDRIGGKKG